MDGEKNGRFVNTDSKNKGESIDARVYRVNYDSLKKLYYILNTNPLTLSKISDTNLVGNVHSVESTTLFTSIPYDEGWDVYVDGKKAEKIKLMDAFIGLKLEKGQHQIEFKYQTVGFLKGAIISGASIAILLLIYLFIHFKNNDFKFIKKEIGLREDEMEEIDLEDDEENEDEYDDDTDVKSGNDALSESDTESFENTESKDTKKDSKIVDLRIRKALTGTGEKDNKETDTKNDGDNKE